MNKNKNKKNKPLGQLIAAGLLALTQTASATPVFAAASALAAAAASAGGPVWQPGFIVLAENRFDPAIQRLIAEHSLRSLPLRRGQLYYVYPPGINPHIEEMQIRYLELLLEKRAEKDSEPDAESP